jgi:hypothetical protein
MDERRETIGAPAVAGGGPTPTPPPPGAEWNVPPPLATEPTVTYSVRGDANGAPPEPPDDGFLTPQKAREARQRTERGVVFTLERTGAKAIVRRIYAADHVAIGQLPAQMQQRVLDGLAKLTNAANAMRSDGRVSRDIALQNMRGNEEAVNAVCVAAFVKPRLIFAEAERTHPGEVVVTDIDLWDRQQVFLYTQSENEEAAKHAAPFLPGPAVGLGVG